jgi:GNAT superfamily N-acetyltransferase
MAEIRPYEARDLSQLAALANAHIAAATPGWTVSQAWIAARLERNPDESIVDPWVAERRTLVAIERERVVACCHLLRYAADERVSDSYSGAGELAWLFCEPSLAAAGSALTAAAVHQLDDWAVSTQLACGGGLGPDVYGVSDCWPHVHRLLTEAGFDDSKGRDEVLYVGRFADLDLAVEPPLPDVSASRATFDSGVAFVARCDGERIGEFRVELPDPTALPALARWADGWGIWVEERYRRQGVARWLVGEAAAWLALAGRDRLIMPVVPEEDAAEVGFWEALGLTELTRIRRGYERRR